MLTQASSDRLLPTTDAGLQATFSSVFQSISWLSPPYEQHIFVHDKISLCFLGLTDWAFINIAKHRHLEFLLLIPMEKNHFLPSSCISRHSNDVMCKQPIKCFCFRIETHIVSLTWLPDQHYCGYWKPRLLSLREHLGCIMQIFHMVM